jgi:DNA-binding MarR family transcriptional regulator
MGKPDIRLHAPLTHGDLTADGSGYLYDAAMRRDVVESGGEGSVEVFEALGALRLAAKRIHEGMDVTPRTMTDIIDVLERDGLVKRVPDPTDRRSVQAVITDAGLERIHAMRRDAMTKQAAVAEGFTADQLVQLRHLCLLLVRNLGTDQERS